MSKIVWIGTGAGFNAALGNTSFLMSGTTDRKLLVDCGFSVTPYLLQHNLIGQITDIVITHHHADHIGGLELLAFYRYFAMPRSHPRPILHLPTPEFADRLWNEALKAGLRYNQDPQGDPRYLDLEDYFSVRIGLEVLIPGLPLIKYVPTPHLAAMENYGLEFGRTFYYSGDSSALPPVDFPLIFQDCQFTEGLKVVSHIEYGKLRSDLPEAARKKTWLVHLNLGWEKLDALADGFAGFVRPGQEFVFDDE